MEFSQMAPLLGIVFVIQLILSFCLMLVVVKYPIIIYKIWKRFVIHVIMEGRSSAFLSCAFWTILLSKSMKYRTI